MNNMSDDITAVLVTSIAAVVVSIVSAVATIYVAYLTNRVKNQTNEVMGQVSNGHDTNLRSDVDDVRGVLNDIHTRINTFVKLWQHSEERRDAEMKRMWTKLNAKAREKKK